jgi:beta-lactam-binding protein with PASTA domain
LADIGTVLGGRYRLVELLGQGGMATIYRARDGQLERDVAVKVLRPEYGADPDFVARFRHEAQSVASLNHPGIVAVYDYGTDPAGPYIVMELVDGEDLASIIRRSGPLPPRQAARVSSQAARAIGAAHDRGLVHRDVKPGNILVTRDGRVKVTDFGIARALAESALTLPGTTLGSVHYFSPEQARGELSTPASDIFSLGIVLYELLTGRRPWEGDSAAAIANARLSGPVPSPSSVRGGIPTTLDAIDQHALAQRPEDRFASAAEMADALDRYLTEDSSGAGAATGAGSAAGAGMAGGAAAGIAGAAAGAATGAAIGAAAAAGGAGGAGVARPNPGAQPSYPADAYARSGPPPPRPPTQRVIEEDDDGGGSSPWLWLSALLALAVLALAGFLVFRLLSSPGGAPAASPQVTVPNLVGLSFEQAQSKATALGLQVARGAFADASADAGTVLSQDPPAGATVSAGTSISLTIARGQDTTIVPNLLDKTESEALNLIVQAGLQIGTRTEDFDPSIAAGSIVAQDPQAGLSVTKGLSVNYVVSKGPEPTPSPTPTPAPTPTPSPTPTPGPTQTTVDNYVCQPLAIAIAQIQTKGLSFTVSPSNAGLDWIVVIQDPAPGTQVSPGSTIHLTAEAAPATCPP